MAAEHFLTVTTPLAKALDINGLRGEERVSAPFHFLVDLVSPQKSIDFKKLVGKAITIQMILSNKSKRYVNGVVTRFTQGRSDVQNTHYHAEIRPWLWLLTLTTDNRIFQKKSTPEILEAVFSEHGFKDFKKSLKATYAKREYCVQYQESSFDFVSRLMEEDGIFYFFDHTKDKHMLVLADDADAHKACPGMKAAQIGGDPWKVDDLITECTFEEQVTSSAYSLTDYNFEIPSTDLFVKKAGQAKPTLTVYDYPGTYEKKDQGDKLTKLRIEACEHPQRSLRGQGSCRAFVSGYKFKLKGHERADLNAEYVLRAVYHAADATKYANRFEAFPATVPFRPPVITRRPLIAGTQTALVVGKKGEEIWTDKYGRIKVQFHWDKKGKKDENSSCWVRVAQAWAGKGFGAWYLPRIGQEVVISFIDGNPDRPLVTGSVYNAQQKVPYALPDNQTKSTVKTNTSKGGGGFNEIRFEDKKAKEEVFIQAQKDMNVIVKHNFTENVYANVKTNIGASRQDFFGKCKDKDGNPKPWPEDSPRDTLVLMEGKRVIKVEKGNELHEVKGKRTLNIKDDELHTNKGKFTHEVTKDYTLKVKGNLIIDVTGEITIKSAKAIKVAAKMDMDLKAKNLKAKTDMDIVFKAGMNLKGAAGMQLDLKGGAMGKVDGGGMLNIKGGLVKIN